MGRAIARRSFAATAHVDPALPVVVVHSAANHGQEDLGKVLQIARARVPADRPAALARPLRSRPLLDLVPALAPTSLLLITQALKPHPVPKLVHQGVYAVGLATEKRQVDPDPIIVPAPGCIR